MKIIFERTRQAGSSLINCGIDSDPLVISPFEFRK